MAVNYTNLFNGIGEHIQRINDFRGYYSALDTDKSEIETDMNSIGRLDIYSGTPEMFNSFKQNLLGWCNQMKSKITSLLTHRTTILEELALGGFVGVDTVLAELIRDMNDNTVTVNRSTVTIGSPTTDFQSANGELILGKVLDRYNRPTNRSSPHPEYKGLDSELAVASETMTFTCTDDSENGTTEGAEVWSWTGEAPSADPFHWDNRGSGAGPTILTLNSFSYFSNQDFESWTVANTPDSWTIVTGTAGTHIFQDTDSGDVHHGSSSLRLHGNASLAAIELTQASAITLVPGRRYAFACWVKGNASLSAGTLTITFTGTGYTAGGTEKIEMNLAALQAQTSYGLEYFYVTMPDDIPSDFKLSIKLSGTPSAHSIHVDWMAFGPVTYHGGVHACIVAGKNKFLKGDRVKVAISNNETGIVQTFFGKAYGVQLPSSGSPSIADSVAT